MSHLAFYSLALVVSGAVLWLPGYGLAGRVEGRGRGGNGEDDALRFAGRWALGLAYWQVGLFALATAQVLAVPGMLALAAGGAVLALLRFRRSQVDDGKGEEAVSPWTPIELLPTLALLLALGSCFLVATNPTVSWDGSTYHLTLPRLFLEHGGFRPVPMNVYSNWPLGTELLFAPALAFVDHALAKLLHFGFGLLVLRTLFLAARPWGRALAWLAVGLLLANGVVLFELRVAYVDLASAFYLLAGLLFLDRALGNEGKEGNPRSLSWVAMAGLCGGLLAGVKITGGVAAAFLGVLLLPMLIRRRGSDPPDGEPERGIGAWKGVAAFAVPAALLALPWLVRNAVLTGNPAYPFLWELWGGPDWSSELGEQLSAWQRGIGMGREPLDYLLLPLRVVLFGGRGYENFDGELGLHWLLAIPLALWACLRGEGGGRSLARRAVLVSALSFVFWALSSQQMRFLIPILPLLALASTLGAATLGARRAGGRIGSGVVLALGSLVFIVFLFVVERPLLQAGASHLRLYLQPGFETDPMAARPPVFDAIDQLPEDARLLMINTNQGFYSSREYLADSFFEASQVSHWLDTPSPEEVARRLGERGISHVLVDRRPRGTRYPRALLELIQDPARARPLHADERHVLLALLGRPLE